jgi:hypothetical protein
VGADWKVGEKESVVETGVDVLAGAQLATRENMIMRGAVQVICFDMKL